MAPKKATQVGGDFLDLGLLAEHGPVLGLFRIVRFEPAVPGKFGPNVPVIADVMICSGPRKGEVHPGEKIIGVATATLRGVKNPSREHPEVLDAVNMVGDEISARIEIVTRTGNPFTALNVTTDPEDAEILKVWDEGRGWDVEPSTNGSAAPVQAPF